MRPRQDRGQHRRRGDDYKHGALVTAVDKFVGAGRTPDAYAELAQTVASLRPQMDRTVGKEAELKMIVLALGPIQSQQAKSLRERIDALALTVWPTLLAPPIAADTLLAVRDPKAPELAPKPGEDAGSTTSCGCAASRSRASASASFPRCRARHRGARDSPRDRTRAQCGRRVSRLLRAIPDGTRRCSRGRASIAPPPSQIADIERAADPDNWPVAGAAAEDDPGLPEASCRRAAISSSVVVATARTSSASTSLRELRGDADVIALHLHPDTTLAQARAVLVDARKAGAKRVAVIAREPFYPYRKKVYWVADGYGLRANLARPIRSSCSSTRSTKSPAPAPSRA